MITSSFGVFGLGVMGKSIAINIAQKKHNLSVYNRIEGDEANVVSEFLNENMSLTGLKGFTDIEAFVKSIQSPRKILLMVNAGETIDLVINDLIPFLNADDIIIDGGNSHFLDSKRRHAILKEKQIYFISCGISGGELGAKNGPSLMLSGDEKAYKMIAPVLESIAAKDKNEKPCCAYLGKQGSGHFIKMIHNGIEYAEMQLLAEIVDILSVTMTYKDIVRLFKLWKTRGLSSYLLEITCQILETKEGEHYILDLILDSASNKGTGSWSSKAALDLGEPNSMMSAAVFARYISTFKNDRIRFASKHKKNEVVHAKQIDLEALEKAYEFARIINHHQGFSLLNSASLTYNWNLELTEIARVWTNGCIIKSDFLEECQTIFKKENQLLNNDVLSLKVFNLEQGMTDALEYTLTHRLSVPCLYAAHVYWVSLTTAQSSANLIQAQRDFFGAHTYKRIDSDIKKDFHTNW